MFTYPVELTLLLVTIIILPVINNNVWMDLFRLVNTIATINIFCLSNFAALNLIIHIIIRVLRK